jgi:hypothetical protein
MICKKTQDEFRRQIQGGASSQQLQPGKPATGIVIRTGPPKDDERNPDSNPGGTPGARKDQGNKPSQRFEQGQDRHRNNECHG